MAKVEQPQLSKISHHPAKALRTRSSPATKSLSILDTSRSRAAFTMWAQLPEPGHPPMTSPRRPPRDARAEAANRPPEISDMYRKDGATRSQGASGREGASHGGK